MVAFRITYARYSDLHDDTLQMARGGLLVKVTDITGLGLDLPASLELVLPDGARLVADVRVIQVLDGHGVAVTVGAELAEDLRRRVASGKETAGAGPARHQRLDREPAVEPAPAPALSPEPGPERTRTPTASQQVEKLTQAEKIQLALHGTRDQRNAILRDNTNRALHPFVLKNPQLTVDDVIAIAKNAMSSPDLLKLIAERREWFQRPQVAVALARNPKTPPDIGVRSLEYVPIDAVRQMAKGTGVLPHISQAARKRVLK